MGRVFSVWLDDYLEKQVLDYCRMNSMTYSELIRAALKQYIRFKPDLSVVTDRGRAL